MTLAIGLRICETYKFLILAAVPNLDVCSATLVDHIEGETLESGLNLGIREPTANETLNVEDTGKAIRLSVCSVDRLDDGGEELTCYVGSFLPYILQHHRPDVLCLRTKHRMGLSCYRDRWQ